MGDSFFEYGGVAPDRFALWEDVLQEIGPARDGRSQRQVLQAVDQLWPHLETLRRLVDPSSSHIAVHFESIQRSLESARADQKNRRVGDTSLDLHYLVQSVEVLALGLIGPEGQSPVAPRSVEFPTGPEFEAWLVLSTGCANLVPGPASTQIIRWRTPRAFLRPAQIEALAERDVPGDARFREILAGLRTDLRRYASRGEVYIGWTAWYGYE